MMDDLTRPDGQPQPNPPHRILTVIGVLALILMVGLLAVHFWPKPLAKQSNVPVLHAGDQMGKIGQATRLGNTSLTLSSVRIITSSPQAGTGQLPPAGRFVDAFVTLAGSEATPANYSSQQFSVWSKGQSFAALSTNNLPLGIAKPLGAGSLKNGAKIEAEVVLPLSDDSKYSYVVWQATSASPKLYVPIN